MWRGIEAFASARAERRVMDRNFYTRPEAGVVSGSANFATLISATPTAYGLVAAQATAYAALNTALQTAYATATEPTTRTPVSIQAKDLALKNVKASAKNLSQMVRATTTVTDAQLVALGLTPRTKPAPRPLTTVAPSVASKVMSFGVPVVLVALVYTR